MRPIKHILCPVGFTEKSDEAVERAGQLAQLHQADLALVHVVSSLSAYMGSLYGFDQQANPEWYLPMTNQAQEKARELLRAYKQKHVPYAVTCKSEVRYGNISSEILATAKELNTDMIILGATSEPDARTSPIGNTVNEVVSQAECPVFVFHNVGEEKYFRKILIPVDLTFGVAELTDYLIHYFSLVNPEVEFLNVIDPRDDSEVYRGRITEYLRLFQLQAKQGGLTNVKTNIILGKNPGIAINDHAIAGGFQLIMMNTHGKSGLGNWIMGGVTHHIVSRSRIPIFTYRAKAIHELEK